MKQKKIVWDYLWYALYAFAGLGLEMVLLSLAEPVIFGGISAEDYSAAQRIAHWLLTSVCWGIIAVLLVRSAKKKLRFDVRIKEKPILKSWGLGAVLVIACIALNAFDWGALKIIREFEQKGVLLFGFQYLYYFFEVMLVFLIVAFGQQFAESLLQRKSKFPWGGILLCCTWGGIHILTQGSIATGLGVMAFSILYGWIYLLLGRNAKYAYWAMAMAFMI